MTTLAIATLFPLDTVAAGDEANGPALVRRARQRGIDATHTTINRPESLTTAGIYLLGGDGLSGVDELVARLSLTQVADEVRAGQAIIVAVDAGLAAIGRSWVDRRGVAHKGLELLGSTAAWTPPVATTVVTRPDPGMSLPSMVGWHSHGFALHRDPGVASLCELEVDPGGEPAPDGAWAPGVVGTQLHGPVLALNPELADLVLATALGVTGWDPLPVPSAETARARRIAELTGDPPSAPRVGRIRARLRRR